MALEQSIIIDELKSKGVDETLATGLSFETNEDLSSWVDAYKTSLPAKAKEIQDYTKEEIEEMAKDPQFKGAKGLQGFFDSLRQKPPVVKPEKDPKPDEKPDFAALIAEAQKPLLEKLETLTKQKESESFDNRLRKAVKTAEITDEELILDIKESLSEKSTEAEIKAKIEKKKAWLAKLGIKQFGTPGGGGGGDNTGDLKKAMEEWNKKQDQKKKKVT